MDRSSDLVHARASGIPRLSKLPLPRASHGKDDSHPPLSQSNQKSRLGKLTSQATVRKPSVSIPSVCATLEDESNVHVSEVPTTKNQSRNIIQYPRENNAPIPDNPKVDTGNGQTSPYEPSSPARIGQRSRKPRPSLSDRTIETLSQIPPSPKKSGFFTDESPMQPPLRPVSALNHSRPNSRAGSSLSFAYNSGRPSSPFKRLATAPNITSSSAVTPTPSRRVVSSFASKPPPLNLQGHNRGVTQSISKLQQPNSSSVSPAEGYQAHSSRIGSKTCAIRPSRTRPPTTGLFSSSKIEISEPKNITNGGSRVELPAKPANSRARENGMRAAASTARSPEENLAQGVAPESREVKVRKASNSSSMLRQTIATAKAARRAALKDAQGSPSVPRSVANGESTLDNSDLDPFVLDLSKSSISNVISGRINSARSDGRLNIAALGLRGIPEEVARMYDQDATNAGGIAWYECVDLVRLNAADNEIRELHENQFPDIIPGPENESNEDHPDQVFASLELIDLHGNILNALPLGFRRLQRLTNLNLSRNRLTNDALEIVGEIHTLRELRMSENLLQGSLPERLCDLKMLEILDIHNNAISCLPDNLARLSRLKILALSDNKLSTVPFEKMTEFPLLELDASKNRLSGSLFPPNISEFPLLRDLSISENALDSFSMGNISLPSLETLNIAQNKISTLPNMINWKEIVRFIAGNNQMEMLPEGLVSLTAIKSIDLNSNKLTRIDDRIGLMVNLQALEIKNNPIRERRLLSLNLEDLKAELRTRLLASELLISPLSPTAATKFPKTGEVANDNEPWTIQSGVLDRSNSKLRDLDHTNLASIIEANVKSMVLHHNALQKIPLAIADLGFSLATLDMSYNKLGQSDAFLTQRLPLPNLQTLNLASNSLTSLSPLTQNMFAPSLRTLNISFNRLVNLPSLREAFLGLTKLLASNNRIVDLEVGSICGLHILDVSSNEITHLPPKLALLQGELKTLMVGGNRFRVPSWGVVQKGTEEILNWLRTRIPEGEEGSLVGEAESVD